MKDINYTFEFEDEVYKVTALKVLVSNDFPVQFHITGLTPVPEGFSGPFVLTANNESGQLEFGIDPNHARFQGAMVSGLIRYCNENGIDVMN